MDNVRDEDSTASGVQPAAVSSTDASPAREQVPADGPQGAATGREQDTPALDSETSPTSAPAADAPVPPADTPSSADLTLSAPDDDTEARLTPAAVETGESVDSTEPVETGEIIAGLQDVAGPTGAESAPSAETAEPAETPEVVAGPTGDVHAPSAETAEPVKTPEVVAGLAGTTETGAGDALEPLAGVQGADGVETAEPVETPEVIAGLLGTAVDEPPAPESAPLETTTAAAPADEAGPEQVVTVEATLAGRAEQEGPETAAAEMPVDEAASAPGQAAVPEAAAAAQPTVPAGPAAPEAAEAAAPPPVGVEAALGTLDVEGTDSEETAGPVETPEVVAEIVDGVAGAEGGGTVEQVGEAGLVDDGVDDDDPVDGRARARAGRAVTPDPICADAVDLARQAAIEEAGDAAAVGEHLGVEAEGERLVLHRFTCESRAYQGWVWTVVTTRAPRLRKVTVDDVVLMPGEDALLAPAWVPWSQRLRPGDVGVGDLLPTAADDPRLALRSEDVEEWVDTDAFLEQGLGRARVLSAFGRDEATTRWYQGEPGPDAHVAKVAPASCLTCGFHVRLAGVLGRLFGVCANELAPDDARVTSIDHGCGAHSEALVAPSAHPEPVPFDEDPSDLEPTDIELVSVSGAGATVEGTPEHPADHVGRPEPYGHA